MEIITQVLLLLLTVSIGSPKTAYGQAGSSADIVDIQENCERGEEEARQDMINGDLGYYFFGDPNPRFNTWMRTIIKEYGLVVKGGGGILFVEGTCYNDVMRKNIEEKYG